MSERGIYSMIFLLIIMIIAANASAQHSPVLSQYMLNGLVINPAYAGSRGALSVTALHRDQWTGIDGAPTTQTLSAHAASKSSKIGLGLIVHSDAIGVSNQKGASAIYAYRMRAGKGQLSFGLSASAIIARAAWTSLAVNESGDPVFQQDTRGRWMPNAGAGAYYFTDKMYAGISVPSLLTNSFSSDGKSHTRHDPSNYNIFTTAGMVLDLGDVKIKPSFLIRYLHASPLQYDLNTNVFIKSMIEVGASYRAGDAVIGMIAYSINDQLKAGYAYDHTLSAIRSYSKASHEFILQYELRYKMSAKNPRYF